MREHAHKREIERLWQEKLNIYRAQREQEWEERRKKEEEKALQREIIEIQKEKLLKEPPIKNALPVKVILVFIGVEVFQELIIALFYFHHKVHCSFGEFKGRI